MATIDFEFPAYEGTALNRGMTPAQFNAAELYYQQYHIDFVANANIFSTQINIVSKEINASELAVQNIKDDVIDIKEDIDIKKTDIDNKYDEIQEYTIPEDATYNPQTIDKMVRMNQILVLTNSI